MSGTREPRAKGKFQLNFTMTASPSSDAATKSQVSPIVWASDVHDVQVPIEETVAVITGVQPPVEDRVAAPAEADPSPEVSVVPLAESGSLVTFRSSPKSKRGYISEGGVFSNKLRTFSVAGWSSLAGTGAILAASGPSSVMTPKLAEVGVVWVTIAAVIWVLTTKLR